MSKISIDGWAVISSWGEAIVLRIHRDNDTYRDYHLTYSSLSRFRKILKKIILKELGEIDNS